MTATENLRRLLDERGVEWRYKDERTTYWYGTLDGEEWGEWTATEMGGHLHLTFSANGDVVTPEQAIAATLGSCNCPNNCTNGERTETCHDKNGFDPELGFECTVCGAMTDGYMLSPADMGHYRQFNFCPMCGRRIEQ